MSGIFGAGQLQFLGGEDAFYGFEIGNSLRFNDDDSAYLSGSSASTLSTYTMSLWLKRGVISSGTFQYVFSYANSGIAIGSTALHTDKFYVYNGSTITPTDGVYRDPSAWYHLVLSVTSNTGVLYINGESVKTGIPSASIGTTANYFQIGRYQAGGSFYFDGYLAEVNFIESALTPASFGEFKENIWIPKDTSGLTFGTNGFRLQFKNSSVGSASSSTVGADTSGNDNHFSSNNIATTDNMTDSPTDNFCVMNPQAPFGTPSAFTLADGNLDLTFTSSSGNDSAVATMGVSSGKFYYEVELVSQADDANGGFTTAELLASETGTDGASNSKSIGFQRGNRAIIFGSEPSPTQRFTTLSDGDVLGFALDLDSSPRTLKMFINGAGSATVDVEVPSNQGDTFIPCCGDDGSSAGQFKFNFGANGFTHTPPSGHVALSTANLPDPAIDPAKGENPTEYFNTALWTGDGTSSRSITTGHQPDWVWTKERNSAINHIAQDSILGTGKYLHPNTTAAEQSASTLITSFDSNGFTIGNSGSINGSSDTYVAWSWKAGGATSADNSAGVGATPTAGSVKIDGANLGSALAGTIAATRLSASTEAGFSVTIYTGNGSNNSTVAHGLGAVPSWVITKARDNGTDNWAVFHSGLTSVEHYLQLNTNGASVSGNDRFGTNEPTSSVMNLGYAGSTNTNGRSYVMYAFAEKEGFSKFGSYTGNGSTDGPFVYTGTGFRPAFVLSKGLFTKDWVMVDNKRNTFNVVNKELFPNQSFAEATNDRLDFVSNGFKVTSSGAQFNDSGSTYIYMAFAEQPFKFSNAR